MKLGGAVVFVVLAVLGVLAFGGPAKAKPAYYDEQLLNYRYTELCASVKRPPKSLMEAIDNAFSSEDGKKDPHVIEGFNYLHFLNQLIQMKCGDA